MLDAITIRGFKRIAAKRFSLSRLTMLTGLNGSGKTSVIQAILLCRHASTIANSSLQLNGPFGLQLGTAADVLNWRHDPPISIEIEWLGNAATWILGTPSDDSLYLTIDQRPSAAPPSFSTSPRAFNYLHAERLGPRSVFETLALPDDELEVGTRGEHSAHVLSVLGDKVLQDPSRIHPLSASKTPRLLKYELEQWLSEIARPIEVTGERNSTIAELRFRVPGGVWVTAPNMGFGLSYSLPVVLAGLIAPKGSLLVVENPEAHLHPAGQSRIGVFLAWVAAAGVQVILETHSDHVLNGVRRAVADFGYLSSEDAVVHYFSSEDSSADAGSVEELKFDASGTLSDWPPGFFDQYQIDVAALGRVRRRT